MPRKQTPLQKILIAVPTFENISPDTFQSIYNMDVPKNVETTFKFVRGYDCARARNSIADIGIEGKYDYIFMVDSDVILPKNALICLLEKQDNVVLGVYPRKNEPSKSEIFDVNQSNYNASSRWKIPDLKKYPGNRIEIRGGGLGCALIKTSIFEEVGYPYFKYVVNDNRTFLSEDLFFCSKVREKNYKIYVDTRVLCGHVGRKIVRC